MSKVLLKNILKVNKGKYISETFLEKAEGMSPLITVPYLRNGVASSYVKNSNILKNNEIVIISDGANSGEIFKSVEGVLSSTLWHLEVNPEFNKDLFFYQLKSQEHKIKSLNKNVFINHLKQDDISYLKFNNYSKEESLKIVNELNNKFNSIDSLLSTLSKKEENLNEYLNTYIKNKFKNNCKRKRIKDLFSVKTGATPIKRKKGDLKNIPLISAKDILVKNKNNNISELISEKEMLVNNLHKVNKNTLLMSIVGSNTGRVCVSKERLCHTQSIISLFANEEISELAYYYFNYVKNDWSEERKGTSILSINSTKVKNEFIYIPENIKFFLKSIKEKEEIIVNATNEIKKQKQNLIELKKSLIKDL
jgi:hypothetical protein